MRGLTTIKARDVTTNSFFFHKRHWVGVKLYCALTGTTETAAPPARPGCERCVCNNLARVIPQTGVTHIIRLIYIRNAAQGDEHDNLPSTES